MNNAGSPNVVSHEYTHAVTMSICGTYSEVAVMGILKRPLRGADRGLLYQ